MAIRYTFARVITALNIEAIRALPDAITGSGAVVFADTATIEDAAGGISVITGSGAVAFTSAASVAPSVGSVAGSAAVVTGDAADITPSTGDVTGSAAVVIADPGTTLGDANSGLSNIEGSTAIAFASVADATPSPGVVSGSAAVAVADATALRANGSVAGSGAAVFSDTAAISNANAASTPSKLRGPGYRLAYRFENRLGYQTSVLTQNVARFYGLQQLLAGTIVRWTSTADITPAVGSMSGSGSVTIANSAVLEDALAGVTAATGSGSITFASSVVLGQRGLEGSGGIILAGAADLTPSRGRLRGASTATFTTSADIIDTGVEPGHGVGIRLNQPFRQWGAITAVALQPRYTPSSTLGALTGSTTITISDIGNLTGETPSLAASAAITFDDTTQLNNVGGPGTVQLIGSAAITFSDSVNLVDVKPMTGTTIVRFTPASTIKGRTRLVSSEGLSLDSSTFLRANAKVETTTQVITFTDFAELDNIGVELITGSGQIALIDQATISGRYVSWFPEEEKPGSWTKESGASDGWNKETSVSDTWVKEAS